MVASTLQPPPRTDEPVGWVTRYIDLLLDELDDEPVAGERRLSAVVLGALMAMMGSDEEQADSQQVNTTVGGCDESIVCR